MDIVDLREFYASRLGMATRKALSNRLRPALAVTAGARVMGLGYAMPYLEDCVSEAEAQLAFMPARQGVFRWPRDGAVKAALVDECDLPLLESVVDVAVIAHALELTESPGEMLKEVWRVLAPLRAGFCSSCRTAGAYGRGLIDRPSGMASLFRGRSWRPSSGKASFLSFPGRTRFIFRHRSALPCCPPHRSSRR